MRPAPPHALALCLAPLALLPACSGPSETRTSPAPDRPTRIVRAPAADDAPQRLGRVSPPATLDGRPIAWAALHDAMVEAAGAVALEETVLDRLLAAEAERLGVEVGPAEIQREEIALENSLAGVSDEAGASQRLLQELRRRRGLGPQRYEALLRRTALMRAIVAPRVDLTEETLDRAKEIRFGEKRRVRIITAPSLIEAQTAVRRLDRGEPFAEVAVRLSTDASAARGGLLEPLSLADPSYPAAFRAAIEPLAPGDVSAPVALDGVYAVIRLEEIVPPDEVALERAESVVAADARAEQERILMADLARRLLAEARLTILDPSLETAWRRRGNQ